METRITREDWQSVPETNELAKAAKRAERATRYVCEGKIALAILCGPPGVGKTQAIKAAVAASDATPVYASPRDYIEMIEVIHDAGNRPIIFEEADQIFSTENKLNVLKVASDTNGHRLWKNKTKTFKLVAPILVATNNDLSSEKFKAELRWHVDAIRSRAEPIVFPFQNTDADKLATWEYACHLAICHRMIQGKAAGNGDNSVATQNVALEWFTKNVWRMDDVSPRRLRQVCQAIELANGNADEWEADCQAYLKRSAQDVAGKPVPATPRIIPTGRVSA